MRSLLTFILTSGRCPDLPVVTAVIAAFITIVANTPIILVSIFSATLPPGASFISTWFPPSILSASTTTEIRVGAWASASSLNLWCCNEKRKEKKNHLGGRRSLKPLSPPPSLSSSPSSLFSPRGGPQLSSRAFSRSRQPPVERSRFFLLSMHHNVVVLN